MNKLTKIEKPQIIIPKCEISKTGLLFDESIIFDEWKEIGTLLRQIEGSVQFWIGDWLNFGKKKYEHGKYDLALQELGYEYKSLKQFSWVSENIEKSRRLDNLDYSHHMEVAPLSPEEQNKWLNKAEQENLSIRELREQIKETKKQEAPLLPRGKYRVIYADPPWKYSNTMPDYFTEQGDHYPLLTVEEIANLPIHELCEEDAVLFLWVTSPILEESFQVINKWGFIYKSSFVWDKVKHNLGHYNSVRHEFLLIAVKGSCQLDVKKLFDSVQTIERSKKHSKKPEEFRNIIDTIYSFGKRIELFARGDIPKNWEGWGNELTGIS